MEEEHVHIMKDSSYADVESESEEEALSLCDLPINEDSESLDDKSFKRNSIRRPLSLPESSEFFSGFSSSGSSDMCPADDIIFRGKLVPFKEIVNEQQKESLNVEKWDKPQTHRRRSGSVSSVIRSSSVSNFGGGSNRFMMRNRSLDYCKLREHSSSFPVSKAPEVVRDSSVRSVASSEGVAKKAMKPRWYSLVFGKMKVPPEMELNDIKNRQVRRNPSKSMFLGSDSGENLDVNRSSGKVSWKILKALSCKDHNSVSVTTAFSLPQASS
ncbi:uncharacterized protein LOC131601071 [Vicia villosa]|uniref:uncharacterized protein LOC131601071 n=1 Tax=Vicia villosa TaxID=3911 RepID=UPI00273B3139|nr:uncharacterized protein LOC131601071 [Vicia villosa]